MTNNALGFWDGGVPATRPARGGGVSVRRPDGAPVRPRHSALVGGGIGDPPYDAANIREQHLAAWQPSIFSPDVEINVFRDRIVGRIRDMVRNDGWAAGSVTRILDNVVGPALRPVSKPDYHYLRTVTGIKAFDIEWAREFGRAADIYWRSWTDDVGRYCDAARNMNFAELAYVAFRHKLVDGDALAALPWLEKRVGYGRARYATAVQLIDPDRLSNPQLQFDQMWMRGGVRIDEHGAAVGYYIRRAHQSDWFDAAGSVTWDLIPRETEWGRPIIVHDFDADRAAQHRGGVGILAPVLARLKMLWKYDTVELDAAIINAIFAAYVESPFDHSLIQEAMEADENPAWGLLDTFQRERARFREENRIMLGNARIPSLYPGEKINAVSATRPTSNFKEFENAVLRNVATGLGMSAQQITNDWSDVNYSSARQSLLESWKSMTRRRQNFTDHWCAPIRAAWMEEAMMLHRELPLPAGAPDFMECRAAYTRCRWMGPGRGWVDPVAEKQGAVLGMQAGLSTLEAECAEQGADWEENLEQRAYEIAKFEELGLEPPDWTGERRSGGQERDTSRLPGKPKRPAAIVR